MGRTPRVLARLGEAKLVKGMLERLIAHLDHAQADNSAILAALGVLFCEHTVEQLKAIVAAHGVDALGACAESGWSHPRSRAGGTSPAYHCRNSNIW